MDSKTKSALEKTLKFHARALDIPSGAGDEFIKATLKSVEKSLKTKSTITAADLTRLVTKELKKYNTDLAYVYQNYDKII